MIETGTTAFDIGVNTWVRDCADLDGKTLTIGDIKYEVKYCGDFAIYYLNRFGGWCAFLFEGPCKRKDTLTSHTSDRSVYNTTIDFAKNRYAVEVKETWSLTTGRLSDSQSERFAADVLPSTQVYAHNLKTNEIFPVVITDTTADFKTFKGQQRKPVTYTLTVERSQGRIRR